MTLKDFALLVGIVTAMIGSAVGYGRSQERIDATGKDVGALSKRADDTEARLRAVEQAQSKSAQAITDIAGDIHEMKRDLKDALKK